MENIEVAMIEFVDGGNTIWIHDKQGSTVLRIKCSGKITVKDGCENICAHADILVPGNIEICMPSE